MYILKNEVEKILEVMNEYPDARAFRLEESGHSGIGSILTLTVETKINGRNVEVSTEISGVENW
jgi:hypothetical protein